MSFIADLIERLQEKFLLKHEFYQAWVEGKLTLGCLQTYAEQYFHHEAMLPRYLSSTHTSCDDLSARQVLLENLVEEEQGDENHPELWLRFAEGVGTTRDRVKDADLLPETKNLIDTFMNLSRSSYAEGLGALYAYERQIPEVAESKIAGLKEHYGIEAEDAIKFFNVHLAVDVWHSDATRDLLEKLNEADQQKAALAACKAADALWNFLSGVKRETIDKFPVH